MHFQTLYCSTVIYFQRSIHAVRFVSASNELYTDSCFPVIDRYARSDRSGIYVFQFKFYFLVHI